VDTRRGTRCCIFDAFSTIAPLNCIGFYCAAQGLQPGMLHTTV
jgi:hypothetical protein